MVKVALEGDGCVSNLYHYLWAKNDQGRSCPGVLLPDTVVYKYRQPAYWYFTSKEVAGQLKMKNKINLGNSKVEESFCFRKPTACDISCYYIATQEDPHSDVTTIEHFDTESLREFLYFRDKENNGILQRFFAPKGLFNTIYRAIWSPNVFLAERRTNAHPIEDRKLPIHKRAVTYEGDEYLSGTVSITDTMLGQQIERLCRSIANHVHDVSDSGQHIGRMVLHFKVDSNDKLWLLWCSSLRLLVPETPNSLERTPVNIGHKFVVPDHVLRFMNATKQPGQSQVRRKVFQCPNCLRRISSDQRCESTYKMVTDYLEAQRLATRLDREQTWEDEDDYGDTYSEVASAAAMSQAGGGSPGRGSRVGGRHGDERVPDVLARLHPNLSWANYRVMIKDPLFQYSRMAVCDLCFLKFTSQASAMPLLTQLDTSSNNNTGAYGGSRSASVPPGAASGGGAGGGGSKSASSNGLRSGASTKMALTIDEHRLKKKRELDHQALMRAERAAAMRRTVSHAAARSTRLAENYVASVSQSALLREFGRKQVGRLPNPATLRSIGAVSAPPSLAEQQQQQQQQNGQTPSTPFDPSQVVVGVGSPVEPQGDVAAAVDTFVDPAHRAFALSVLESEEAFLSELHASGNVPPGLKSLIHMGQVQDAIAKSTPPPGAGHGYERSVSPFNRKKGRGGSQNGSPRSPNRSPGRHGGGGGGGARTMSPTPGQQQQQQRSSDQATPSSVDGGVATVLPPVTSTSKSNTTQQAKSKPKAGTVRAGGPSRSKPSGNANKPSKARGGPAVRGGGGGGQGRPQSRGSNSSNSNSRPSSRGAVGQGGDGGGGDVHDSRIRHDSDRPVAVPALSLLPNPSGAQPQRVTSVSTGPLPVPAVSTGPAAWAQPKR